jgi:hypothetical protein
MISEDNKDFAGKNGFTWFIGIVEDRQDPLKLGRCRVRCVGWHAEDKMQLPTEMLPWAMVTYPINNTNTYAPKEGDMVFGFFADGESGQNPIVMGSFPSIPLKAGNSQEAFSDGRTDAQLATAPVKPSETPTLYPRRLDEPSTSRLARNDVDFPSPINESKAANRANKVEPNSYYAAIYPYNNVYESESGHAMEFDDTKGAERIHLYHRSGSYVEWGPAGDRSERIQRDKFSVVIGDDSVYVQGNVNLFIDGNVTAQIGGNVTADIGGNVTADIGGQVDMTVGGTVNSTASSFNLTGDLNVTGTIKATQNIIDGTRSMANDRAIYNSHRHGGVQPGSGTSGSPTANQ